MYETITHMSSLRDLRVGEWLKEVVSHCRITNDWMLGNLYYILTYYMPVTEKNEYPIDDWLAVLY
jgi:hypothetical protein